jgi:hypothetical protein
MLKVVVLCWWMLSTLLSLVFVELSAEWSLIMSTAVVVI